MNWRRLISGLLFGLGTAVLLLAGSARAQQAEKSSGTTTTNSAAASPSASQASDTDWRAEAEKRFRANCGRCHQSPHKFPPRMVMTIERHMRVRATLTDEDMRLIVRYLTQ